jgi:cephalosporin hydroxylase
MKKKFRIDEVIKKASDAGVDHIRFGGSKRGGVNVQQMPDEIGPCLYYLQDRGIQSYLEIGAASGGLTFLVNKILKPKRIVIVDDNKHRKNGLRSKVLRGVDREEIIGDSQSKKIVQKVKELGQSYDLIVIDADHSFKGVMADIKNYANLCEKYLVLHDTVCCKGVREAFERLQRDPRFQLVNEFKTTAYRDPCGVGLFWRHPE